jgi:hypothetical protein
MNGSKIILLVLLMIAVGPMAAGLAQEKASGKQRVLDEIDKRIDGGDLDGAKRMIDHFLEKNPGDADLKARLERWKKLKGGSKGLLEEKGLEKPEKRKRLRELCWQTIAASMKGNPEEWEALLFADDGKRARALLSSAGEKGGAEDRRTAKALIERLDGKKPAPLTTAQLKAAFAGSDAAAKVRAYRAVEDRKLKSFRSAANKGLKSLDAETRFAAAGAALALGAEKPRQMLLAALKGRPFEAALAMEVLARQPGQGEHPLKDLYAKIEADEEILRVKGTLLAITLKGIGATKEAGGREFLTKKLGDGDTAVDAARALGAFGDAAAVPALLGFVRSPPKPKDDDAAGGGLGFLGGAGGGVKEAAAAEELRPRLVGALAILRITADAK